MEDALTDKVITYFIEKDLRTETRNEIRHKEYTELIERVGTKILTSVVPHIAGKLFTMGVEKDGEKTTVEKIPGWNMITKNPNPDPLIDEKLKDVGEVLKNFLKIQDEIKKNDNV